MPDKVIIIVFRVRLLLFAGINSPEPLGVNTIIIIITLEDIEEINTEKKTTKQSEEYFFPQRCEKTSTNFEMAYDYLILTFYWFISAGKNAF